MKTILVAICCLIGFQFLNDSQELMVKGHVTQGDAGDPVIGASIIVQGTHIGTVTDFDGYYELKIPRKKCTVVFNMTGFIVQKIYIDSSQTLDVALQVAAALDEVVVSGMSGKSRHQYESEVNQSAPSMYQMAPSEEIVNWNTEDYDLIRENGFISTDDQQLSTFSIDVDRASYSNIRRFISQGVKAPVDAVRIEEMINYFDYSYPQPSGEDPLAIYSEMGACPWNKDHQLLHIGVQSEKIKTEYLPASNLVFLIDVSGSMNQANKLPLLISSFRLLVDQLRPQDRVSMVTYAGASAVLLNGVGGSDREKILEALDQLRAGGSTAGAEGIRSAYQLAKENFIEDGNNRIILATDGDFNIGVSSDAELVRLIESQRDFGVFLSVLGFGMGNYKDNKMQKLADSGNGNHQYIDDLAEAKKVFVDEFGANLFTVAKDVKIQIEFNPEKVAGYRLIGYENRKLENRDFNDDQKDAGEIGNGHTVTVLYEIVPQGIDSEWLAKTDKRYSKNQPTSNRSVMKELAFIKLRYKDPDGSKSKLLEKLVDAKIQPQNRLSENFFFASSVAGFGMLLRDSEFKQNMSFDMVLTLAKKGLGKDEFDYRSEFIDLVKKANRVYLFDYAEDQAKLDAGK